MVRFVWTSATFVGVVGLAASAAAAAAADKEEFDSWRLKTAAAAVAALGFAVAVVSGCLVDGMVSQYSLKPVSRRRRVRGPGRELCAWQPISSDDDPNVGAKNPSGRGGR